MTEDKPRRYRHHDQPRIQMAWEILSKRIFFPHQPGRTPTGSSEMFLSIWRSNDGRMSSLKRSLQILRTKLRAAPPRSRLYSTKNQRKERAWESAGFVGVHERTFKRRYRLISSTTSYSPMVAATVHTKYTISTRPVRVEAIAKDIRNIGRNLLLPLTE